MRSTKRMRTFTVAVAAASTLGLVVASTAQAASRPDPRQAQLDRVMRLQPGGVQVSDNAVVWGDGDVVMVVPDAGKKRAPAGLGHHVRTSRLNTPGVRALAESGRVTEKTEVALSTHGCPGGLFTTDYYCFYQYRDFGGRRVQFTGNTSAADAADWGFDNGTTSWVSNDVDCVVRAYNPERPTDTSNYMWKEPENSVSTYVGSTHDNKMSYWTCH